jgi:hypothetical protein
MSNIIDYAQGLKAYSFDKVFFKDLDVLALTEVAYLPFEQIITEGEITLEKLAQYYTTLNGEKGEILSVITTPRIDLLRILGRSTRYGTIEAFDFINKIDSNIERQFSAITYRLEDEKYLVVFRGTDENLIGWKEDFHMTFMHEVPAQQSAYQYLEKRMTEYPGEYIVSGHSKGGNLAIYACSKLDEEKQNSVAGIYAFDAPGLHESLLESEGFLRIKDRIASYIPQDSMVSVLLEPPVNAKVVKSNAILLLQHDTFSWEVGQIDFVQIENQSQLSIHADKVISSWLDTMSNNEKQEFSDVIFDVFLESGINKFADITVDTPKKIINIVNNMTRLTSEQKKMTIQVFFKLFNAQFDVFKSYLPKPIQKVEGKVEHFAKSAFSNITGVFKKSKRKGK